MSKINQNWAFGHGGGLDFSFNPPKAITTSMGSFAGSKVIYEGCASISDENGNLVLYTDGVHVWDGAHSLRTSSLKGDYSSTQSAIIVPNPGNKNEYYIFTMDGSTGGTTGQFQVNHFDGVLINVSTSNWTITPLSNLMTLPTIKDLSPCEKLTAIQHKNCKDFWVVTVLQRGTLATRKGKGVFRVFKVDANGVSFAYDVDMDIEIPEAGYLKGSPDGTKIAMVNTQDSNILLYDFNNTTGKITIPSLRTISTKDIRPYCLEFSPNSKLLYYVDLGALYNAGSNDASKADLFQVDLTASTLNPNVVHTFTNKGGGAVASALQLGPDGSIYIAKDRENTLAAILDPNTLGTACNVDETYVTLNSKTIARYGLPNLIPNPCSDDGTTDCGCRCEGCNENHETQNEELIERAKLKFNTVKAVDSDCEEPFMENCTSNAINEKVDLSPCFSFHWGDGKNDQIEEHDTEVFYLTVCNKFNDITYRGLKITKVSLIPDNHPLEKIQIVPDRFVSFDCLTPCSCEVREFAMITRATDTAGDYLLHVEYCYDEIIFSSSSNASGSIDFPLVITED